MGLLGTGLQVRDGEGQEQSRAGFQSLPPLLTAQCSCWPQREGRDRSGLRPRAQSRGWVEGKIGRDVVAAFWVRGVMRTGFEFGKTFPPYLQQKEQVPFRRPDSPSSCCFAQYTISLHNRQNNLIFSLATQLSFQSIIPNTLKKRSLYVTSPSVPCSFFPVKEFANQLL